MSEAMKNCNTQVEFIDLHQPNLKDFKLKNKLAGNIFLLFAFCIYLQLSFANAQNTNYSSPGKTADNSTFTKLFDFYNAASGSHPTELIKSGNFLYGVTPHGGPDGAYGILYKIKTDGTEPNGIAFYDYYNPNSLTIIDTMVYGIMYDFYGYGQLYHVSTRGNDFDIMYNFDDANSPIYKITSEGNTIYGINYEKYTGKSYLFKINSDGSDFQKFQSVGDFPYGKIILADDYLYGTTAGPTGSTDNNGTVYRIKRDGIGFKELFRFTTTENGDSPIATLTPIGSRLYGTAKRGGIYNQGVIFSIKNDGTNFKVLHSLQLEEGAEPKSKMVFSGKSLYGTAYSGGLNSDHGTLFKINPDGSGFKKLYDFQGIADGSGPVDLIISNDTIFGITENGGINDDGTIFRYIIDKPQITPVGPPKIITLSISKPEEITPETKKDIIIDSGKFIDLDTTFSVEGNIPYTHSWNIKTGNDYQEINNKVNINQNITFYLFVTTAQGCTYTDSVTVQAKNITGIEESVTNENQIIIYPNPNPGIFQIEILNGNANYEYDIFDVSGRKVANGNIFCQTNECVQNIKLDNVKPGAYNLVIRKADKFYGQKKLMIHSL